MRNDRSREGQSSGSFFNFCGEYHLRSFKKGMATYGDHVHQHPMETSGRTGTIGYAPGVQIEHLCRENLAHMLERHNHYTTLEVESLQGRGVSPSWQAAVDAARQEVINEWPFIETEGTRSVACAMMMFNYRMLSHMKLWEEEGWPDLSDSPATAEDALRGIADGTPGESSLVDPNDSQVDGNAEAAKALRAYQSGDFDLAFDLMRAAFAKETRLEFLNDLAVISHARGDRETAEVLLRACLIVAPDRDDARANLDAVRSPVSDD